MSAQPAAAPTPGRLTDELGIGTLADVLARIAPIPGVVVDERVLDVPFPDLGYDSLLLMQVRRELGRDLGLRIPSAAMLDVETPRMLLGVLAGCRPVGAAEEERAR